MFFNSIKVFGFWIILSCLLISPYTFADMIENADMDSYLISEEKKERKSKGTVYRGEGRRE